MHPSLQSSQTGREDAATSVYVVRDVQVGLRPFSLPRLVCRDEVLYASGGTPTGVRPSPYAIHTRIRATLVPKVTRNTIHIMDIGCQHELATGHA